MILTIGPTQIDSAEPLTITERNGRTLVETPRTAFPAAVVQAYREFQRAAERIGTAMLRGVRVRA